MSKIPVGDGFTFPDDTEQATAGVVEDNTRSFWYSSSEPDDSKSGKTIELAKKTIQACIDEAVLLTPPPGFGNSAFVREGEGGRYIEGNLVFPDGILLAGPQTAVVSTSVDGIELGNYMSFDAQVVIYDVDNGTGITIDGKTSVGMGIAAYIFSGENSVGVHIKGSCDNIFSTISQIEMSGDGSTAVKYTGSSPTPIDFNYNKVTFAANNQTFFDFSPLTADDVGDLNLSSLALMGGTARTGTTGIKVTKGILKADIGSLDATTLLSVSDATFAGRGSGTRGKIIVQADGICNYTAVASHEGDLEVQDGGVLQIDALNINGNLDLQEGGNAGIQCQRFIGELVKHVSSDLFVFIDTYTGTTLVDDGSVHGFINGVPYGTYVASTDWGEIGGTLSNQTDLQTDLDAKLETVSSDTSLTGDGTSGDPLSVVGGGATSKLYAADEDNALVTVLPINDWILVNVTPTVIENDDFLHDGSGVFTYDGVSDKTFDFTAALSQMGIANDKMCEFAWFKNDNTQMMGKVDMDMSSSKFYGSVNPSAVVTLTNGDDMRVCMRNTESSENTVIVNSWYKIKEW